MKAYKLYIAYLEEVENDEAIIAEEARKAEEEARWQAEMEEELAYEREAREALNRLWKTITTSTDKAEVFEAAELYSDIHKDVYGFRPRYFGENYTRMCREGE